VERLDTTPLLYIAANLQTPLVAAIRKLRPLFVAERGKELMILPEAQDEVASTMRETFLN
jgi:hypothetical protein